MIGGAAVLRWRWAVQGQRGTERTDGPEGGCSLWIWPRPIRVWDSRINASELSPIIAIDAVGEDDLLAIIGYLGPAKLSLPKTW